jgi:S-adenosylmethionine decarboxylase
MRASEPVTAENRKRAFCPFKPREGGPEMGETFGLHLMADGYGCDPSGLNDEDFLRRFLNESPGDIAMTRLMSPYAVGYEGIDREACGLSGFALIAESHASIHTFPPDGYVSIDVFSCKPFDTRAAETEIVRRFGIPRSERSIPDPGIEYPANPGIALDMVEAERKECRMRATGAQY